MTNKNQQPEYMQTLTLVECRKCGTIWYEGDEKIVLQPEEEVQVIHMKRSPTRCKFCRHDALGRG